ncbi:MAG: hypothetical protein WBW41_20015, partial [Verrucomicrobiia bacterium]
MQKSVEYTLPVVAVASDYFGGFCCVLTQDKCYRDGELDEGFSSSLTQDRGYPSNEHESAQQTGVF